MYMKQLGTTPLFPTSQSKLIFMIRPNIYINDCLSVFDVLLYHSSEDIQLREWERQRMNLLGVPRINMIDVINNISNKMGIPVKINNYNVTALLDSGSDVSVIQGFIVKLTFQI